MKKKLSYLMLIVISIVGSRLIFGKDYHLNSNNLVQDNLYLYQIFDGKEVLSTYVSDEHFYYVVYSMERNNYQYTVTKYNLISNHIENQYVFNYNEFLNNIKLFKDNGNIYLTTTNSSVFYKFDKHLNVLDSNKDASKKFDAYGLFNDDIVYTINNDIFYQNKVYDTVPTSCGKSIDFIYDRDTYIHFHNSETGFGCLYDLTTKTIEYLDYEDIDKVKNYLLEYQSNRLSFKFNGNTYYFNDITESDNIVMHSNGDYLFTIDTTGSNLRIYNLETQKIIYSYKLPILKNAIVNNIMVDDYAYFTITNDNKTELYIWDYIKESRKNSNMISYNEKEYKFKNNELKEEIHNKYQIDVYLYDQAVEYFDGFYVIPSYDDILINSRLRKLRSILEDANINYYGNSIRIYFDKDIVAMDDTNIISKMIMQDASYAIVINITNDNFEDNIKNELIKIYPEIRNN